MHSGENRAPFSHGRPLPFSRPANENNVRPEFNDFFGPHAILHTKSKIPTKAISQLRGTKPPLAHSGFSVSYNVWNSQPQRLLVLLRSPHNVPLKTLFVKRAVVFHGAIGAVVQCIWEMLKRTSSAPRRVQMPQTSILALPVMHIPATAVARHHNH